MSLTFSRHVYLLWSRFCSAMPFVALPPQFYLFKSQFVWPKFLCGVRFISVRHFSLSIFIFSAAASSDISALRAALAQEMVLAGVPKAGKINDFLFRGAHPSKQGLAHHKQQGITAIVKLPGWGAKSRPSASKPNLSVSASPRFPWVAGRLSPMNRSFNSWLFSVTLLVRRYLSAESSATTTPGSCSRPVVRLKINGRSNKPLKRCIASAFTTIGIPR